MPNFVNNPEIQQGAKQIAHDLDNAKNSTQAEACADRLRADYLKCSELGMGKNQEGGQRWNAIVQNVYMDEKPGKGWDVKVSDKNNDGILEMTLIDPNTGFSIFGTDWLKESKTINRVEDSQKGLLHHAESSADNSKIYPEMGR